MAEDGRGYVSSQLWGQDVTVNALLRRPVTYVRDRSLDASTFAAQWRRQAELRMQHMEAKCDQAIFSRAT